MSRSAAPPRLAPLASAGCGTEKRTFHVLRKPDILFAPDMRVAQIRCACHPETFVTGRRIADPPAPAL